MENAEWPSLPGFDLFSKGERAAWLCLSAHSGGGALISISVWRSHSLLLVSGWPCWTRQPLTTTPTPTLPTPYSLSYRNWMPILGSREHQGSNSIQWNWMLLHLYSLACQAGILYFNHGLWIVCLPQVATPTCLANHRWQTSYPTVCTTTTVGTLLYLHMFLSFSWECTTVCKWVMSVLIL